MLGSKFGCLFGSALEQLIPYNSNGTTLTTKNIVSMQTTYCLTGRKRMNISTEKTRREFLVGSAATAVASGWVPARFMLPELVERLPVPSAKPGGAQAFGYA